MEDLVVLLVVAAIRVEGRICRSEQRSVGFDLFLDVKRESQSFYSLSGHRVCAPSQLFHCRFLIPSPHTSLRSFSVSYSLFHY